MPMHDALTDVLSTVRLRSAVFACASLHAPWGVSTRGLDGGIFHAVVRGRCVARLDARGAQPIDLAAGDVVLFPHGDAHTMRDHPRTSTRPIRELVRAGEGGVGALVVEGRGEHTQLVCGRFDLERAAPHPLLSLLPRAIHLGAGAPSLAAWLGPTVQLIASELERREPGGAAIVTRLADTLVVHAIRACIRGDAMVGTWLGALRDPQIARALDLLHAAPREAWTVGALAERVGMSRSAFFERWSRLVGESPAVYATRWRMHVAARLLREEPSAGLADIADRVGYASEAAFSKAFKRVVGEPPSVYRDARLVA